jgi:hypothetical protein
MGTGETLMHKEDNKNEKKLQKTKEDEIEVFDVRLPDSVAAKDESEDGMLKKLECED